MKNSNKWETIMSIIIIVTIISIIIISMIKIIEYDNKLNYEIDKSNYIYLLERNSNIIAKKIKSSVFSENEIIYLYKSWSNILAFSWSENMNYKYINYLWEYVSNWNHNWAIYERQCLVEKDFDELKIIKCSIKELIKK